FCALQRPRPRCSTRFPYTTLFRSLVLVGEAGVRVVDEGRDARLRPAGVVAARELFGDARHRQHAVLELQAQLAREVVVGEGALRSEEHTSELQSRENLVCRLLLEK